MKKLNFNWWDKVLKNDNTIKVMSLILALLLFITVNQSGNPIWKDFFTTTKYVDSVPLNIEYDKEKYVVTGVSNAIPVNITGSENNVNAEYTRRDSLVGTLEVNYLGVGEFTIGYEQINFNSQSGAKITSAIPRFDIKIQEKVKEDHQVDISYVNGQGSKVGYILNTPTLSKSTVSISGGNNDIDSIVSVMGLIDLSTFSPSANSLTQKFSTKLVPYDKDGQVVSNVSIENPVIDVLQPYEISTFDLPVQYEFVNNSTGKYVSSICEIMISETCDPTKAPSVKVYGDKTKISQLINQVDKSVKYKIDLTGFKGNEGQVTATPILDSGVYVLGEYNKTYSIKLEDGVSRTIEGVTPQIYGLDRTLQAKAKNPSDAAIDVTITGAKSVVDKLESKDIVLSINLSDVITQGEITVPINVKKDKNFTYKLEKDVLVLEILEVK